MDEEQIFNIITQLTSVSEVESKLIRGSHIQYLTPVNYIYEDEMIPETREFTFMIGKEVPNGEESISEDFMTSITSEELYSHYLNLANEEFINKLNNIIYSYLNKHVEKAKDNGTWNNDNHLYKPVMAFENWFTARGIDPDQIGNFIDDELVEDMIDDKLVEDLDYTDNALWSIADDLRYRKDEGEFKTYAEAYRWGEKYIRRNDGLEITADKLENAYYKAKSEGVI